MINLNKDLTGADIQKMVHTYGAEGTKQIFQNSNKKNETSLNFFPVVVFLVFLVLKLMGVISWSWVWVCAPLWIGFVFAAVIIVICLVLAFVHRD